MTRAKIPPRFDYAGEPMKPGEVRDAPSEIDNLRAQLESAKDEAATYHRLAMDKADQLDKLKKAIAPFAQTQCDGGHDLRGYDDQVIIRIEATVGELRRAREAFQDRDTSHSGVSK